MTKPARMGDFFNSVHKDYDEIHTSHIDNGKGFYTAISKPILSTEKNIKILNIGCGTGLEFESILLKVPNADIDCIDLSPEMLNLLKKRLKNFSCDLNIFCCSYLDFVYQDGMYNYIIASATLHHLLDSEKLNLYFKLLSALKNNGIFIIGDKYVLTPEEANIKLAEYNNYIRQGIDTKKGQYHIDIPTTTDNERILLKRAGFNKIKVIWQSTNYSIITCRK